MAAAAFAPVLIAAVAVVWPPMPDPEGRDQWRSRAAIAWVGLFALLLVGSMLVLEIRILAAGGDQALLPSLEVAYALILAIAFLSLFAALGVTRGDPAPGWRGHGRMVHAHRHRGGHVRRRGIPHGWCGRSQRPGASRPAAGTLTLRTDR